MNVDCPLISILVLSKQLIGAFTRTCRLALNSLTVSHLARARSSSNLANSRLSWMVTSSFQIRRAARPRNKMAPATDRRTTKMSGPLGQSGWKEEEIKGMSKVDTQWKISQEPGQRKSDFIMLFPACLHMDLMLLLLQLIPLLNAILYIFRFRSVLLNS